MSKTDKIINEAECVIRGLDLGAVDKELEGWLPPFWFLDWEIEDE